MLNSKQIMKQLKEKVVGQDEYVRQLSIFGFKHELNQKLIEEGKAPINNNLLVVGPTGSGKTFAAKELSRILNIPFFEVDCSNIVQTGYRGTTSVEHILRDAASKLHRDVEHAIIYLDEFDKVYDQALDVRGEGTAQQQNFLKMLEPNDLVFKRDSDRYDHGASYLNTGGISFIATGSFDFVRRKNAGKNKKMGFDSKADERKPLTKDDIIAAGFIPELIGRFGTIINLNELDKDDYYEILINSRDSAYTQYQDFFKAVNVKLTINSSVFRKIADEAFEKKVGARGLNDVLGTYLVDSVFDISCDDTINKIEIKAVDDQIVTDYRHRKTSKKSKDKEFDDVLFKLSDEETEEFEAKFKKYREIIDQQRRAEKNEQ